MATETRQLPSANTIYLTTDAYLRIMGLDHGLVGTGDYMGIAYFWSWAYRHPMRETTAYQRVRVHRAFLDAGLKIDGESPAHEAIITRIAGR